MNTAKSVDYRVSRMKPGQLFSYADIPEYRDHSGAVVKALTRKAKNAEVLRLKKGLYYKPEKGTFGVMSPKDSDIIKHFTQNKGKVVGYITGLALFHRWGLTTQVPVEVSIATTLNKQEKVGISGLRISTVPAKAKVTKDNTHILQFLDVLRDIDRIPDADMDEVVWKLGKKLNSYVTNDIARMEKLAIEAYSPKTKALLGAFLEGFRQYYSEALHKSLNPTTKYKLLISRIALTNLNNWYISSK